MRDDTAGYNIATIRALLLSAFTAESLRRFCQDRPAFRPVCNAFGSNYQLDQMVDRVVDFCETQGLFGALLAEVKTVNPQQYARFEEHLRVSNVQPPPTAGKRTSYRKGRRVEGLVAMATVLGLLVATLAFGRDFFDLTWLSLARSTPTVAPAPTAACPITAPTDAETLIALIDAEGQAVLDEDMARIVEIFAPDARITDVLQGRTWDSPVAYYTEKFQNEIHCQVEHLDLRILKLRGAEAEATTANKGQWGLEAEGCVHAYANPSAADQWYFHKDDQGCWRVVRFTFNAHLLTPVP